MNFKFPSSPSHSGILQLYSGHYPMGTFLKQYLRDSPSPPSEEALEQPQRAAGALCHLPGEKGEEQRLCLAGHGGCGGQAKVARAAMTVPGTPTLLHSRAGMAHTQQPRQRSVTGF